MPSGFVEGRGIAVAKLGMEVERVGEVEAVLVGKELMIVVLGDDDEVVEVSDEVDARELCCLDLDVDDAVETMKLAAVLVSFDEESCLLTLTLFAAPEVDDKNEM